MPPLPKATPERKFRLFLMNSGFRVTPERMQILKAMQHVNGHIHADDLAFRLHEAGARVSRATVYRTLTHLVEAGLVRKVNFGEGHACYELAEKGTGHHDHLLCQKCGKVVEFLDEALEAMQDEIAKKHDFLLTGHQFQLYGICGKCRGASSTTD